jgi:predicted MFS family arabinose efflux permease
MTETRIAASRGDVAGTGGGPLTGRALRLVMLVLAFACGASVANLYYAQPLLGLIRQTFGVAPGTAALVVTVTQVGYAVGLALLLPLGDLLENRKLSSRTLVLTAVALAVAAFAPGFGVFLVAVALVGVTSVVAQVLIPLAAHLAPPQSRGKYVGQVTGGLLLGIMLARSAASLAAAAWGWRSIYAVSAGVMLATALALARLLPRWQPRQQADQQTRESASYGRLVASSVTLARAEPLLLRRALSQALMFGAFTAYWTAIAFELTGQHHLTQAGIALFALVGAGGAVAAPVAGRLGDRGLGVPVRGAAIVVGVAALLLAATAASHLVLLALSAVLLDFAVQGGHVLNMRDFYALRPDARARMNSVYMTTIFAGGAAASAVAGPVSQHWGWPGVAVFAAILVAGAGLVWTGEQLFWRQRPGRSQPGNTASARKPR